jgi:putative hydrolase of the HAD superfamily
MRKIGAVLFDYGMVLSGAPDMAAREQMQSLLGADAERFHGAYWRYRDAYDRGALNGVGYWRAVAGDLGREVDEETLTALLEADVEHWGQPNEAMIAWARRLQRAGVRTGVLSNLGDAMEAGILARFDWLRGFTHHTFSHRLGMAKPDAAIYRYAAEGLGVKPEEILFVDDREENVAGARAVGMVAIQYGEHQAFVAAMREAGWGELLIEGSSV